MERESFEDREVAAVMNEHFICIKVDREERPDVDQVHMEAVQMMSGQGGWPLNCFTTPDGLPVYGGTYFKKEQWLGVLQQLATLWSDNPAKVVQYGKAVKEGMDKKPILAKIGGEIQFEISVLDESVEKWMSRIDDKHGGPNRAPKFPLPGSYDFLLNYAFYKSDKSVEKYINLSLEKMARGGLYDQVGGGFTRYSTDVYWKVPHFEKMLYDNAQLIGLYSEAFKSFERLEYKKVVEGTIGWLKREMKDTTGGFYSALDADSEGEEGKFYTWSPNGVPKEYSDFYETGERGLWEAKLIPVRKEKIDDTEAYFDGLNSLNTQLLKYREKRIRPETDTKIITSWNAMLAKSLAVASANLGSQEYLHDAEELVSFLEKNCYEPGTGKLYHTITDGKRSSNSFLEDYAFLIDALISLYEVSGKNKHIEFAKELCHVALDKFYDEKSGLFNFVDVSDEKLVSTPTELSDNVVPATNSVMTGNLFKLSSMYSSSYFEKVAERLLKGVEKGILDYGEGYFRWMKIWLNRCIGSPEVVVTGPSAMEIAQSLRSENFPLSLRVFSSSPNRLEIFKGRIKPEENLIHICQNHSCKMPQREISEARKEIRELIEQTKEKIA